MSKVGQNFDEIKARIKKTAKHWDTDASNIELIAVSKKQPQDRIQDALEYGHRLFGENRVQEAMERWDGDDGFLKKYPDTKLHLIGPLQTNKVKQAVSVFNSIEAIDSEKLALAIKDECEKQDKEIECLVQVNTGEEEQKAGVSPKDLPNFLKFCEGIELSISGLMCIPPVDEPAGLHFAFLKELADRHGLKKLSMGMSSDFEQAVPLNPTYLRIGSALFGERPID